MNSPSISKTDTNSPLEFSDIEPPEQEFPHAGHLDGILVEQSLIPSSSRAHSPIPDLAQGAQHLEQEEVTSEAIFTANLRTSLDQILIEETSLAPENTNHLASASALMNEHPRAIDQEDASTQEYFERALEMIRGRGLAEGDKVGGKLRSAQLDGVEMIAQLAEGKIEFPLKGSFIGPLIHSTEESSAGSPEYSLDNYSLRELRHGLAFALQENIHKLKEQEIALKSEESQSAHTRAEYLASYQQSIREGAEILLKLTEEIEEPGIREEQLLFERITMLHECFSTHRESLEALSRASTLRASTLRESTLRESTLKAMILHNLASAQMGILLETSRENPREHFLADFREVIASLHRAEALLEIADSDRAIYLINQAHAHLHTTLEASSEHLRDNILTYYHNARTLFTQALEDLDNGETNRAKYFNDQGYACLLLASETSREYPRTSFLNACNETIALYDQTLAELEAGEINRSIIISKKARTRLLATSEIFREHPRANMLDDFDKLITRFDKILEILAEGDFQRAAYLHNQATAHLFLIKESYSEHPRASLLEGYGEVITLSDKALRALASRNVEQAEDLYRRATDLLWHTFYQS